MKQKCINLSKYERQGLVLLQEKREVSESELVREAIRLLMKNEGVVIEQKAASQ